MGRPAKFKVGDRVAIDHLTSQGIVVARHEHNNHSSYYVLLLQQRGDTAGSVFMFGAHVLRKMSRISTTRYLKVLAWNKSIEDRGCDCHCCPHVSEENYE